MRRFLEKVIITVFSIAFWGCLFYGLYTIYSEFLNAFFFYIILPVLVLTIVTIISRHFYKRNAVKKYLEKKELDEAADKLRKEVERKKLEHLRDSDKQTSPYTYQIGKHANEALAIRYGIANLKRKVKEYLYYGKGGARSRNPERDVMFYEPAKYIRLQKNCKLKKDKYEVLLKDYRDRKAIAVIEVGTEYVKTFYPFNDNWFEKHEALETTLKGNGSFTLKELATFHVQKTVS